MRDAFEVVDVEPQLFGAYLISSGCDDAGPVISSILR